MAIMSQSTPRNAKPRTGSVFTPNTLRTPVPFFGPTTKQKLAVPPIFDDDYSDDEYLEEDDDNISSSDSYPLSEIVLSSQHNRPISVDNVAPKVQELQMLSSIQSRIDRQDVVHNIEDFILTSVHESRDKTTFSSDMYQQSRDNHHEEMYIQADIEYHDNVVEYENDIIATLISNFTSLQEKKIEILEMKSSWEQMYKEVSGDFEKTRKQSKERVDSCRSVLQEASAGQYCDTASYENILQSSINCINEKTKKVDFKLRIYLNLQKNLWSSFDINEDEYLIDVHNQIKSLDLQVNSLFSECAKDLSECTDTFAKFTQIKDNIQKQKLQQEEEKKKKAAEEAAKAERLKAEAEAKKSATPTKQPTAAAAPPTTNLQPPPTQAKVKTLSPELVGKLLPKDQNKFATFLKLDKVYFEQYENADTVELKNSINYKFTKISLTKRGDSDKAIEQKLDGVMNNMRNTYASAPPGKEQLILHMLCNRVIQVMVMANKNRTALYGYHYLASGLVDLHPEGKDIFRAVLYGWSFALIPYFGDKSSNRAGSASESDALDQINTCLLFFGLCIRIKKIFTPEDAWEWLTSSLTLKPDSIKHSLQLFFEVCGAELQMRFGKQFLKLVEYMSEVYKNSHPIIVDYFRTVLQQGFIPTPIHNCFTPKAEKF